MKSVVLFTSLSMGMAATLLMGFLAGSTVTIIVYLAGSNILLSHELRKALAAQRVSPALDQHSLGQPALDQEGAAEVQSSSAADSLSRKQHPTGKGRPRYSHQDH